MFSEASVSFLRGKGMGGPPLDGEHGTKEEVTSYTLGKNMGPDRKRHYTAPERTWDQTESDIIHPLGSDI